MDGNTTKAIGQKSEEYRKGNKALLSAQKDIPKIGKDGKNPFLKNNYATLDHILSIVTPVLNKHGLVVTFPITGLQSDNTAVSASITYEGELIANSSLIFKTPTDMQKLGSAITYAKRYNISSLLAVATGDDDDGERAVGRGSLPGRTSPRQNESRSTAQSSSNGKHATDNQIKAVKAIARKNGITDVDADKMKFSEASDFIQRYGNN
jgi:hypothetical protein